MPRAVPDKANLGAVGNCAAGRRITPDEVIYLNERLRSMNAASAGAADAARVEFVDVTEAFDPLPWLRVAERHLPTASEAIRAVSRVLGAAAGGPEGVRAALVDGARELLDLEYALVVAPTATRELTDREEGAAILEGQRARELSERLGLTTLPSRLVLIPLRPRREVEHVLVLAPRGELGPEEVDAALAFARAAAASLAQIQLAQESATQAARQAALARAAHSLHESLDLATVLSQICREATEILEADLAVVWRGNPLDGVTVEAVHNFPPETIGYELAPGAGLAGRVIQSGKSMIASDYQSMIASSLSPASPFKEVQSVLAVPMEWEGERRGVLAVGYTTPTRITADNLKLLEAFAELSAVACANASAHAGLAHAARTDSLTGCLNHAALQEALRREVERCVRGGGQLSLVMMDLDDFKEINEESGHLVGDEVLRRVGHSLRHTVRPYDLVARYGGDEFAIVCVDADEVEAGEIAGRAIAQLGATVQDLAASGSSAATAGVAQWEAPLSPTELIGQADRALLYGKQEGPAGSVVSASTLPPGFRPGRFRRDLERAAEAAPATALWAGASEVQTRRLQKRTRQLALANELGTRVSAMTDAGQVVSAAIDELHRAFGYFLCAGVEIREDGDLASVVVRGEATRELKATGWTQPYESGIIGRCLRERRTVIVNDVTQDADYKVHWDNLPRIGSELCVPLWVGDRLWGVIDIEESEKGAFDEDDARLVQTVADMVGSALRSALLYEQLDRAYMGTAEALAAALEAKDAYTASHSRSIVEHAAAVGKRLGMGEEELRNVRYAAVFHDIGKIAVPESILNKKGPLTPEEWAQIERHPMVGEQILAPVELLADVRPLVRHEHERWDGTGYPDRLKGEEIPLGSRIVLACDAYDAMTTDRPYRPAMSEADAREELRGGSGTQFDPRVVDALLAVLEQEGEPRAQPAEPAASPTRRPR